MSLGVASGKSGRVRHRCNCMCSFWGLRLGGFSVVMDDLVLVSCEVVTVGLVYFGVMDSFFGGCLELFNAKEWTSGGMGLIW